MSVNRTRSWLYGAARLLGDYQAVRRGPSAVGRRLLRKAIWRAFGRAMGGR